MRNKNIIIIIVLFNLFSCLSKENKIFEYVKNNDIENVKKLITKNQNVVYLKDENFATPLHDSCLFGYYEISKVLIQNHALININDEYYHTPLTNACEYYIDNDGPFELLSLLIENGAKLYDDEGNSILQNMLHIFEYEGTNLDNLEKLIDFFIKNGVDLDTKNNKEDTLLHSVVNFPSINLNSFKLLIDKGANIHIKDNDGKTVLLLCVIHQNFSREICDYLLSKGANINEPDNDGNTPLVYALRNPYRYFDYNYIKYLLDNGANLKVINNEGETVLHQLSKISIVSYNKDMGAIGTLLLDIGVDVKKRDSEGNLAFQDYIKNKEDYKSYNEFYNFLTNLEALQND